MQINELASRMQVLHNLVTMLHGMEYSEKEGVMKKLWDGVAMPWTTVKGVSARFILGYVLGVLMFVHI